MEWSTTQCLKLFTEVRYRIRIKLSSSFSKDDKDIWRHCVVQVVSWNNCFGQFMYCVFKAFPRMRNTEVQSLLSKPFPIVLHPQDLPSFSYCHKRSINHTETPFSSPIVKNAGIMGSWLKWRYWFVSLYLGACYHLHFWEGGYWIPI